ncbi:MAG: hypothetical protein Q7S04_02345 [Candidatus Moranbacteria bacterium]|nr:hypothetical protein [Candidatus Moranbacteria bacterium]
MKVKKVIVPLYCAIFFLLALGGCGGDVSVSAERSLIEKNQGRSWDNLPGRQKISSNVSEQIKSAVAKKEAEVWNRR